MVQKLIVFGAKHPKPPNITTNFIDVQSLNNPTDPWIYPLTGLHTQVYSVVTASPNFNNLVQQTTATFAGTTCTEYGIMCSGGRHRSPAFAWYIARMLGINTLNGYGGMGPNLEFVHQDVQRMYNLLMQGYTKSDAATRWAKGEG